MRKKSHASGRFRGAESVLFTAMLVVSGCSFDTNELKGYPGIDSSTAVDGPPYGVDGLSGILNGTWEAGPNDSGPSVDSWFDAGRDSPSDAAVDFPSDSPLSPSVDAAVESPKDAAASDAAGDATDVRDVGTGGTTGSGGATGSGGISGGASGSGGVPASCAGLTATCGPSSESCCKSLLVPGGTFYRSYDGVDFTDMSYPATVADFYLDKYEITVGRFRQFVNAGMGTQGNPPASGAGANPLITGSGWDSTWNTNRPANTAGLEAAVKCDATYQTWTNTAGSNESQPMNCLDWYTAFAFCAWDGGRLPTEAEWNYAASGGSEQRYYPWSSPPTSTTIGDAVYCGGSCNGTQNVGSKSPKGDGKWGQSDLAGNVWEWMLDSYASPYENPCNNCADLTRASNRVIRGGGFYNYDKILRSALRWDNNPWSPNYYIGARCARTSP